jgi:hypothetical protein
MVKMNGKSRSIICQSVAWLEPVVLYSSVRGIRHLDGHCTNWTMEANTASLRDLISIPIGPGDTPYSKVIYKFIYMTEVSYLATAP